ncbi:MAG: tRNA uracil 4-sulfurtransferase ThiI [Christensenellaceae bacterium]|jgi:thiamine biosynthesis protein ThiI
MQHMILVRYGEIHLKGKNRPYFEKVLRNAIAAAVRPYDGVVTRGQGRYYVREISEENIALAIEQISKVFGVHSISPAIEVEKELDTILQQAYLLAKEKSASLLMEMPTFKVESKRSDKHFPLKSMELSAEAGGYILTHLPNVKVDVRKPDFMVHIEIRESAFLYVDTIPGRGGMPVGTSGKAMLLLSGGIDSPVAGYMIAKRGVEVLGVHYHSFPYTSERAKEKVISLAKIMSQYTGAMRLHMIHFTEIQMEIYEKCPEEQLTILMRVFMMKIAEILANKEGCGAIITGESLAQVASQTMASLNVTNSVVDLPVFRPLIGLDKEEIMLRAKEIDTYETSILPYEDCCTVFVPKHPVTQPRLEKILKSLKLLDVEALIADALSKSEVITVTP